MVRINGKMEIVIASVVRNNDGRMEIVFKLLQFSMLKGLN